jgi:oligopeptide/dipeptide ABC transporter ATP-binding protein
LKEPLLKINGLKTHFHTYEGTIRAVDGVDFCIEKGETIGLVGESGCGKSVTALSILGVIPQPPGRIVEGKIVLEGEDLLTFSTQEMRSIRGKDISMILQDPMTNLNPVFTVGEQIAEAIRLHSSANRKEVTNKTVKMLEMVGIPSPRQRIKEYPHQLSGGMRQRVMIAMALSCNPKLLIADEPTTALDVTIQAQILELMATLKEELGMAILLITHDLGIVAETAQRVIVMYAGNIVEETEVQELFGYPTHPYTKGLLESVPRLDHAATEKRKIEPIPGVVPNLLDLPPGCKFAPRCTYAMSLCKEKAPPLFEKKPGHKVRCWLVEGNGH